jgi:ribosomal protein S15P/S13E
MTRVLLQTRVSPKLARWVEREAARSEMTVAGWLREHLREARKRDRSRKTLASVVDKRRAS